MVYKSNCPMCGRRHRFKVQPKVYETVVCKQCQVRLFVTGLNPIELEMAGEPSAGRGGTPQAGTRKAQTAQRAP